MKKQHKTSRNLKILVTLTLQNATNKRKKNGERLRILFMPFSLRMQNAHYFFAFPCGSLERNRPYRILHHARIETEPRYERIKCCCFPS